MSDEQKMLVSKQMKGKSRNFWEVLDHGILKPVPEVIMTQISLHGRYTQTKFKTTSEDVWVDDRLEKRVTDNPKYLEPTNRMKWADDKYMNYMMDWDWLAWAKGPDMKKLEERWVNWCGGVDAVHEYLGIIPFIPSVMINISPDWKIVKGARRDSWKIKLLENELLKYLRTCNRWDKASYVIENGSDGDHIHLHCVAQMSKATLKSVETHVAKGGISTTLQKQTKKLKGMEGLFKGVGIQTRTLRTELLVSDKLDYLIDAKKPEGHKNHSVIFEKKDLVF